MYVYYIYICIQKWIVNCDLTCVSIYIYTYIYICIHISMIVDCTCTWHPGCSILWMFFCSKLLYMILILPCPCFVLKSFFSSQLVRTQTAQNGYSLETIMNPHELKATTCSAGRFRHRVLVYAWGADFGDRLRPCLAVSSCMFTQSVPPHGFNSKRERKFV